MINLNKGLAVQTIGREQILEAQSILQKYKQGKSNLENKIIENEQWYKVRHWEQMRSKDSDYADIEPSSAWLFNMIANKHADAMDNFPSPNILPREEGDKEEAKKLSSIIPYVLTTNDFEQTYSDSWWDKLKNGTGAYSVMWNPSKLNGLGDIEINHIDLLNLFWESGIKDIQDSQNIFYVALVDNKILEGQYPQLRNKLGSTTFAIAQYIYDDSVDTSEKSAVVDWYYKRFENGKNVLHYCKFVNDEVLFSTENDKQNYPDGWYSHGKYPFVLDVLYPIAGTPTGFGYIDIEKSPQKYIDIGEQALLSNMIANSRPRVMVRNDASLNEEEYANLNKSIVHVNGNLSDESVKPIQTSTLSNLDINVIDRKIEEMKETSGNRDASTGGTTSGVTAASAIAAMQEAGSKLSRDNTKAGYRAFKNIVYLVIELIRQFYDIPRQMRITGEQGDMEFVSFSNMGIKGRPMPIEYGVGGGMIIPQFDIEVVPQKQNPYSKMAQNELALQFYQAGFFNPQLSDQALACLDMMDFDRKDGVVRKISENGTMFQQMLMMQKQMLQLAQMVDSLKGTNIADQLVSEFENNNPNGENLSNGGVNIDHLENATNGGEPKRLTRARQEAAERATPR